MQNVGGTIFAGNGSIVRLESAFIDGGTFNTAGTGGTELGFAGLTVAQIGAYKINIDKNGVYSGFTLSPNSLHPDSVNAFFCDGSGRSISGNMSPDVYIRIMSSNGTRHGQGVMGDNAF